MEQRALSLAARGVVAVALLVAVASCCKQRMIHFGPIRDHLETYVFVGAEPIPKCPLPPSQRVSIEAALNEDRRLWIRAVIRDNLSRGIANVPISFRVVDEFGDATNATISPSTVRTGVSGFVRGGVTFRADSIGTYRVVLSFPDRGMTGTTLSQPIIVVSGRTTRDRQAGSGCSGELNGEIELMPISRNDEALGKLDTTSGLDERHERRPQNSVLYNMRGGVTSDRQLQKHRTTRLTCS